MVTFLLAALVAVVGGLFAAMSGLLFELGRLLLDPVRRHAMMQRGLRKSVHSFLS